MLVLNSDASWGSVLDFAQEQGRVAAILVWMTGCHPSEQVRADLRTVAAEFAHVFFVTVERTALATQRDRAPVGAASGVLIQTHVDDGTVRIYKDKGCVDSAVLPGLDALRALVARHAADSGPA